MSTDKPGAGGSGIGKSQAEAGLLTIRTARMDLIAATPALLQAELTNRQELAEKLSALIPENWPPELYDQEAALWTLNYLSQGPERAGWGLWYCILHCPSSERTLIGIAGYKGVPTAEREVEIGYGVLKEYRRAGYASEAARALVERAFRHNEVDSVIAETFPEIIASIRVLEKNGFSLIGPGSEEGAIRFRLDRSAFGEAK